MPRPCGAESFLVLAEGLIDRMTGFDGRIAVRPTWAFVAELSRSEQSQKAQAVHPGARVVEDFR